MIDNEQPDLRDKVVKNVIDTVKIPVKLTGDVLGDTTNILQKDGELTMGKGLASGVFAMTLAFLCFLGVLAFHFPQYLTTRIAS